MNPCITHKFEPHCKRRPQTPQDLAVEALHALEPVQAQNSYHTVARARSPGTREAPWWEHECGGGGETCGTVAGTGLEAKKTGRTGTIRRS